MTRESCPQLLLQNQLCFPLYAASRLMVRAYSPFLEPLGLTYLQYIVLMILWEDAPCTISLITEKALLETSTITPLLKRMEKDGLVTRTRSKDDERTVIVNLTKSGRGMKDRCASVPFCVAKQVGLSSTKMAAMKKDLDKLISILSNGE